MCLMPVPYSQSLLGIGQRCLLVSVWACRVPESQGTSFCLSRYWVSRGRIWKYREMNRFTVTTLLCGLLALVPAVAEQRGEAFFDAQVVPRLAENGCVMCHSPGRGYVRPAIEYRELLTYLAMGQSADNNVLVFRLANLRSLMPGRPAHFGGQRCASLEAEPCRTLMGWWEVEFGEEP